MSKIYISSCEPIKSGVKNDRRWTLYRVTTPDGKNLTTFEPKYVSLVGQEVEVMIEERESTKINPRTNEPYKNLTIVEPKQAQIKFDDLLMMINDLDNRVKELEQGRGASLGAAVRAAKGEDIPSLDIDTEDIKADDLPF